MPARESYLSRIADTRQIEIQESKTDSTGYYLFEVPEGDSILNTLDVQVGAAWLNSMKYSEELSSLEAHDGVKIQFEDTTATTTVLHIDLSTKYGVSRDSLINVPTTISVYRLSDSTQINPQYIVVQVTDTTSNGFAEIALPSGRYIVFAQPDSEYESGYYRDGGYAATWDSATIIELPDQAANPAEKQWYVILPQDSSVMQQSGNDKIDGVVQTQSGGTLGGAHLLLYQTGSGPAGNTSPKFVTSIVTNAAGDYSFGKLPPGTYSILVDIVGTSPYWVGPVYVHAKPAGFRHSGADWHFVVRE